MYDLIEFESDDLCSKKHCLTQLIDYLNTLGDTSVVGIDKDWSRFIQDNKLYYNLKAYVTVYVFDSYD